MTITPERLAQSGSEHGHQSALFLWARDMSKIEGYEFLDMMFAIPNGGGRDNGAHFAAEGVKSGVPDLMLPIPIGPYHGLFIEMKAPNKGVVSKPQEIWHAKLQARGYQVFVCWHWEDARNTILDYIAPLAQRG